jgi:hypothetical protein
MHPESNDKESSSIPRKTWKDLDFLNYRHDSKLTTSLIHDAHISLVICGSDHTRWTCYAFAKTEIDNVYSEKNGADDKEEISKEEAEQENIEHSQVKRETYRDQGDEDTSHGDEIDEDEPDEDPIASDCESYEVIADQLSWDPRLYFLRNVDFRVKQVLREWMCLVRKVEVSVNQKV